MHVADIDGRIHEKRKREARRELTFAAGFCGFLLLIFALVICMGGNQ